MEENSKMISIDSFRKIKDFCQKNNKSLNVQHNAYCIFVESISKAIEENEKAGTKTTATTYKAIESAFLTDVAIQGHVAKAEELQDTIKRELIDSIVQKNNRSNFWMGVLSSFVGTIVFSLFLLAFYVLAVNKGYDPRDIMETIESKNQAEKTIKDSTLIEDSYIK
jgi:hypothetical protein